MSSIRKKLCNTLWSLREPRTVQLLWAIAPIALEITQSGADLASIYADLSRSVPWMAEFKFCHCDYSIHLFLALGPARVVATAFFRDSTSSRSYKVAASFPVAARLIENTLPANNCSRRGRRFAGLSNHHE
jgi:hypothetical protein